jgi:hypothetical protein
MSLVNDALRKARLEATRQDINRSGAILPTLGQVRKESEQRSFSLAAAGLIGLVVIAILTVLFFNIIGREDPSIETGQRANLGAGTEVRQESSPEVTSTRSRETTSQPTASAAVDPALADGLRERRPGSPDVPSPERQTPEPSRVDRLVEEEVRSEAPPRSAVAVPGPTSPPAPQARKATLRAETVTNETSPTTQPPRQAARPTVEPVPKGQQAEQPASASVIAPGTAAATTETSAGKASGRNSPPTSQPDSGTGTDPAGELDVASYVRQATVPGIGTFSLEGIAWSSDRPFALINGQVVGPGGFVDGVNLTEVAQDRVVLQKDGRRFELTLR